MVPKSKARAKQTSHPRGQPQGPSIARIAPRQQANTILTILSPETPNDGLIRIKIAIVGAHLGTDPAASQDIQGPYAHWNFNHGLSGPSPYADTCYISIPNANLQDMHTAISYMVANSLPFATRTEWKWVPGERWTDVYFLFLTLVHRETDRYPETAIPVVHLGMLHEIVHWFRTQPVFMERFPLVMHFGCAPEVYTVGEWGQTILC